MLTQQRNEAFNVPVITGLSAWKAHMVTREDKFHIHKTLGALCLLSYIFRLAQIGETDMGFSRFPALTVPTLILHLLMNLSSFLFQIPSKRILSGYRIWPQYRLHSLVFLSRALLTMAVVYYEDAHGLEPNYDINLGLVFLGLLASDTATSAVKPEYRSNTIRDLDTLKSIQFCFILAQFYGTSVFLYGMRRFTIQMLAVIVIQGE
jgi:hypothetical protein